MLDNPLVKFTRNWFLHWVTLQSWYTWTTSLLFNLILLSCAFGLQFYVFIVIRVFIIIWFDLVSDNRPYLQASFTNFSFNSVAFSSTDKLILKSMLLHLLATLWLQQFFYCYIITFYLKNAGSDIFWKTSLLLFYFWHLNANYSNQLSLHNFIEQQKVSFLKPCEASALEDTV